MIRRGDGYRMVLVGCRLVWPAARGTRAEAGRRPWRGLPAWCLRPGRSVGPHAAHVEVTELRLGAADGLQLLEERRGGRMTGVGHRLGVAGELHHGDVPAGPVAVGAEEGPAHGALGPDRAGPPVRDRVPFSDAVGVELDELDER